MSAAYATRSREEKEEEDVIDRSDDEEEYEFDDYEEESADEDNTSQPSAWQSDLDNDSGGEERQSEQDTDEYAGTIHADNNSAKASARSTFSATAPVSAPPSRPLSAQSRSQLVTSAISDEEESDSDNSSDRQDEYDERAVTRHRQASLTPRPHTADNKIPTQRHTAPSTHTSRPSTAAATRQPYQPSSLALRLEASGTIQAIQPLSGAEWRARLARMKAQIVKEGYSRGERLNSAGDEEKQQLEVSHHDTHDTTRSSITSLNQAGFARAAQLSQQAASLSTARSSASSAPSPHTTLALRWNAYAKDQEGMDQEMKSLKRDKRHLLALLDTHTLQLTHTQQKHERLVANLTTLAHGKGMQLIPAADGRTRAEAASEVGEGASVRLNPLLSVQQVAACLQREVARLEVEKERKECEQDDIEEQQRLDEERAADEERYERQSRRGDDEYSDDDEQQRPRLTQRHRLRVLREKKAALLQKVHELQEHMQRSGEQSGLSSKDSATVNSLTSAIATARTHADTYEEQLVQRQRQLDRVREDNARLAQQLRAASNSSSTTKATKHRDRV